MADSVHCADDGCEFLRTRLRLDGPLSSRPILLTVSDDGPCDGACRMRVRAGSTRNGSARNGSARGPGKTCSLVFACSCARRCAATGRIACSPARSRTACSTTGAQLRIQEGRYQGGRPGWMGPLENRVRAAVFSGCRNGGARPLEAVTGSWPLRDRARPAAAAQFGLERAFATRVLKINHSLAAGCPALSVS